MYSLVPQRTLARLGIRPTYTRSFTLADGTQIKRRLGHALFNYKGVKAPSPVIFGEEGDSPLFGIITLETLGLMLDPFRRELRPMRMILAGWAGQHR